MLPPREKKYGTEEELEVEEKKTVNRLPGEQVTVNEIGKIILNIALIGGLLCAVGAGSIYVHDLTQTADRFSNAKLQLKKLGATEDEIAAFGEQADICPNEANHPNACARLYLPINRWRSTEVSTVPQYKPSIIPVTE